MARVDLSDVFFEIFDAAKPFVPESDHVEMCVNVMRSLDDQGYNLRELYGIEETVDEALEVLYPDIDDNDFDEDNF